MGVLRTSPRGRPAVGIALAILLLLIVALFSVGLRRSILVRHTTRTPSPGTVQGRAIFGGGPAFAAMQPERNMRLRFESTLGHLTQATRTDRDGRYSVRLPPGTYLISIQCSPSRWWQAPSSVHVVSGLAMTGPLVGCGANSP
jgi:hypothetical protein